MVFDKLIQTIKDIYHGFKNPVSDFKESTPAEIEEFVTYCKDKNLEVLVDTGAITTLAPEYSFLTPQPGYLIAELKTTESGNPKTVSIKSRVYTPIDIADVIKDFKTKTDSLLSKLKENNVKYQIPEEMHTYFA